jgi:hypothetical protein
VTVPSGKTSKGVRIFLLTKSICLLYICFPYELSLFKVFTIKLACSLDSLSMNKPSSDLQINPINGAFATEAFETNAGENLPSSKKISVYEV